MIPVTGATGSNGAELVKLLASRGVPGRAMERSKEGAAQIAGLPGIELVTGDFDDPASLENALSGVERAFLLTNSTEQAEAQQRAFVDAARRSGLRRLVKLCQFAADAHSPVRLLRYHAAVERAIREAGVAYTSLRPNLFMQNLLGFSKGIRSDGKFFAAPAPAPAPARVSVVDVRDNAAVAAAALTEPGHEGRTYTLTGPEALTHAEMAAIVSAATGRPIAFVDVPPGAMRDALVGMGAPPWQTGLSNTSPITGAAKPPPSRPGCRTRRAGRRGPSGTSRAIMRPRSRERGGVERRSSGRRMTPYRGF